MPCQRIPQGVPLPTDGNGNPLPGYPIEQDCNENCCKTETGSFSSSLTACQSLPALATVINNFDVPALLTVNGSADDDFLIDGQVYEPGAYPFNWANFGSPCGSTNQTNGSHRISEYTRVLQPGESVTLGGKDNGFGGGVSGSWTLSTIPVC